MSSGEKGAVMRWVGCTSRQSEEEAVFEMAVLQKIKKIFPVKGSRGRRVQSVYTLGEFLVPEIHERGREKRSLTTTGALVNQARRRKRARAQTCRSAPGSGA